MDIWYNVKVIFNCSSHPLPKKEKERKKENSLGSSGQVLMNRAPERTDWRILTVRDPGILWTTLSEWIL